MYVHIFLNNRVSKKSFTIVIFGHPVLLYQHKNTWIEGAFIRPLLRIGQRRQIKVNIVLRDVGQCPTTANCEMHLNAACR